MGKTQTAVEYAYRYYQQPSGYDWVLWVNASSLTLAGSFGAIATDLALPNHQENKLDENIAAVKHWLATHDRWLLIFDNVDDPDVVQPFLPNAPHGRILITSRLPRLEKLGVGRAIALDTLAPEEAHTFLQRRTQRDSLDSAEQKALETLAQELGYLPLALEQAAAYVQAKQVSFATYLRAYQQRRLQVLEKEQPQVGNYPDSVATTWSINFEAVQASSPAAADVLRLSAFLAPDNIPYEILILGKAHLGVNLWNQFHSSGRKPAQAGSKFPGLKISFYFNRLRFLAKKWTSMQRVLSGVERISLEVASDEVAEDETIVLELLAKLTRYSLIRLETENRCYSIHRLVQEAFRDSLTPAQRHQWLDRAVNALNAAFPDPEFQNWGWCDRLVEQVQAINHEQAMETLDLARLLNQTGYFLYEQGRYGEAEPLCTQALEITRSQLGSNHPDIAQSLNNLASLYDAQGRYGSAEPLYTQALKIWRSQLEPNHPLIATSLNNLAELYRAQGRYGEAEPLYTQALEITRSQLGPDHPDTATTLSGLAELYCAQGRYGEAEPLYTQALEITRSQLGADHPNTATSLNNLALLYDTQGRYEEAEPLYTQALEIWRSQLGADHPNTAITLSGLAALYDAQGRYGEAEPLLLQALSIQSNQLGESHPNTQTSWQYFVYFLQQVIAAGRTAELSNHPFTQNVLEQLQTERKPGFFSQLKGLGRRLWHF